MVLPAISVMVLYANAVWWTLFKFLDSFVWATVFHGVQDLAIVLVFRPSRWRGWASTPPGA
ncbi:MAG: hypothetical protein HY294_16515 [Candidatus Rokubacteria bacterium]|nr:hypothetical protein [Candidatus Rokubacteria bacterium]